MTNQEDKKMSEAYGICPRCGEEEQGAHACKKKMSEEWERRRSDARFDHIELYSRHNGIWSGGSFESGWEQGRYDTLSHLMEVPEVRELVEALDEIRFLKLTCEKLILDKIDRDWVLETNFDKWHSIQKMQSALTNLKATQKERG